MRDRLALTHRVQLEACMNDFFGGRISNLAYFEANSSTLYLFKWKIPLCSVTVHALNLSEMR